ncbi:flagellar motor switch protein FliM [Pseudoduganella lurida]|uniref:Flagellar motor switch protein FliM n=1 Tax=Pseudoduganella lurida TaxID=1036180 RepID=A0A562RGT7_9BURK|nr:FliM/FliN family flagellar motor switch protein [Pseudoduganella lurida]TWI67586.1 flagellar motor switch protein FliM [Pseudoduganella lurida]
MTILQTTAPPEVLDPALLGRPVHRLPQFAARLREALAAALRAPGGRRYWAAFELEGVAFARYEGGAEGVRWQHYSAGGAGVLGFALERKVLLGVLDYRYARGAGGDPVEESRVRVTATEERLAVVLGQQLALVVGSGIAAAVPGGLPLTGPLAAVDGNPPARGSWIVTMTVRQGDSAGRVWFALDKALMSDVLRALQPERERPRARKPAAPLPQRLQVALAGRLVSKEVTLGALFDLRVGDVIPVSLHRADVMLEESRLFTAAVTEHKGKLCLTSFEDIE